MLLTPGLENLPLIVPASTLAPNQPTVALTWLYLLAQSLFQINYHTGSH